MVGHFSVFIALQIYISLEQIILLGMFPMQIPVKAQNASASRQSVPNYVLSNEQATREENKWVYLVRATGEGGKNSGFQGEVLSQCCQHQGSELGPLGICDREAILAHPLEYLPVSISDALTAGALQELPLLGLLIPGDRNRFAYGFAFHMQTNHLLCAGGNGGLSDSGSLSTFPKHSRTRSDLEDSPYALEPTEITQTSPS